MNIDELLAQLFQLCKRSWCVIDKRTALACSGEFPADDTFMSVEIKVIVTKEIIHPVVTDIKHRLHHTTLGSVFHGLGICALATQQTQCTEDDRLTRTRLASDGGKARM